MAPLSYLQRRGEIETYFDRTAAQAWARLTSDAPVGRIRASVRAGRDRMRETLLGWLPADLRGTRLLDAGCGTGALAVEAARRGARVVAIDLSPTLVELARQRQPAELVHGAGHATGGGHVDFRAGDMLDPALGRFDYIVGMDSLIHYRTPDAVRVLAGLAQRADRALLFTFAPSNPALILFRAAGRLFPRGNRAPWIEPVAEKSLHRLLAAEPTLAHWQRGRTRRVASGFYTSQALEMVRA
ncbi:magnesium protoporphyrin IX methyltransferase [Xylophilus sp. ASV27]|uniref:magnesium protoporphyrin IX methyltransferase n=1 Tax=Xylophilus sp. ASV27 TaxID=2795129 RepID=UPI0018EBA8AE|nr:magnesium protoporphyrin IX methyltransferase [Xylophilus sp. ASV27]